MISRYESNLRGKRVLLDKEINNFTPQRIQSGFKPKLIRKGHIFLQFCTIFEERLSGRTISSNQ